MNSNLQSTTKHLSRRARRGLTLVEILVSMAIMIVLASMVLFSGQTVRRSRMRAAAEQQMLLIAAAIEQYAAFWPRWEVIDPGTYKGIVVADKGWPDFIPGRLFAPPVFQSVTGINSALTFDPNDIFYSTGRDSFESTTSSVLPGDVLNANSTLVYALTAETGKGPFVSDKTGSSVVVDIAKIHKPASPPYYPPYAGAGAAMPKRRQFLVDSWGTPYRYFWVCRDKTPPSGPRAYKGFIPVTTADVTSASFAKADTFVLESAGPDKKFGNVWKFNPTPQELDEASDNLTVMP
jgi:type II secretory pathway pseudopilin PulG